MIIFGIFKIYKIIKIMSKREILEKIAEYEKSKKFFQRIGNYFVAEEIGDYILEIKYHMNNNMYSEDLFDEVEKYINKNKR